MKRLNILGYGTFEVLGVINIDVKGFFGSIHNEQKNANVFEGSFDSSLFLGSYQPLS